MTLFGDAGVYISDTLDEIPGVVSVVAFEGNNKLNLRRIGDNFNYPAGEWGFIRFYAQKGHSYRLSVDSTWPTKQYIRFTFNLVPANDFASSAITVSGKSFQTKGDNTGATSEDFEVANPHAAVGVGKSMWWKWTPDFDGEFIFNTRGTGFDTVLAVYTGSPPNLTPVASNDDRNGLDWTSQVKLNVTSGETYHIAVDSYDPFMFGSIILNGFQSGGINILDSPQKTVAKVGELIDFPIVAVGANSLEYIWKKDGVPLAWPKANNILYLRPVRDDSYGMYSVDVTDGESTVSAQWELEAPKIAPYITRNLNQRIIANGAGRIQIVRE